MEEPKENDREDGANQKDVGQIDLFEQGDESSAGENHARDIHKGSPTEIIED